MCRVIWHFSVLLLALLPALAMSDNQPLVANTGGEDGLHGDYLLAELER